MYVTDNPTDDYIGYNGLAEFCRYIILANVDGDDFMAYVDKGRWPLIHQATERHVRRPFILNK